MLDLAAYVASASPGLASSMGKPDLMYDGQPPAPHVSVPLAALMALLE